MSMKSSPSESSTGLGTDDGLLEFDSDFNDSGSEASFSMRDPNRWMRFSAEELQPGFLSIPAELQLHILELIADVLASLLNPRPDGRIGKVRRNALRACGSLALSSVHFAQVFRPYIFKTVILRSAKDLYSLLTFLRAPCSARIPSIGACLHSVFVYYRLSDYFWCHNLQRLRMQVQSQVLELHVHISGTVPTIPTVFGGLRVPQHPLFHTLPRPAPFYHQGAFSSHLVLDDIAFPSEAALENLVQDVIMSGLHPLSIQCTYLSWPDTTNQATSLHFCHCSYEGGRTMEIEHCTDVYAVARTVYGCLRGPRAPRTDVLLSPSSISSFFELLRALSKVLDLKVLDPSDWGPGGQNHEINFSPRSKSTGDHQPKEVSSLLASGLLNDALHYSTWEVTSTIEFPQLFNDRTIVGELTCLARPEAAGHNPESVANIYAVKIGLHERNKTFDFDSLCRVVLATSKVPSYETVDLYLKPPLTLSMLWTIRDMLGEPYNSGKLKLYTSRLDASIVRSELWETIKLSDYEEMYSSHDDEFVFNIEYSGMRGWGGQRDSPSH